MVNLNITASSHRSCPCS